MGTLLVYAVFNRFYLRNMKLHLPARLRAALLACCSVACTISPFFFSAAPAYALTAEGTHIVSIEIDTATTMERYGVSYSEGVLTLESQFANEIDMFYKDITFDLRYKNLSGQEPLIYVQAVPPWGFSATEDGGITGYWINEPWDKKGTVSAETLAALDTGNTGSVRLSAHIFTDGTALAVGDTVKLNNSGNLYNADDLKATNSKISGVVVDPNLISRLYVNACTKTTYSSGGKSVSFDCGESINMTDAWHTLTSGSEAVAEVAASKDPLFIGGKGGLFLDTYWGPGAGINYIVLENDLYLADAPSHGKTIEFGNDGGRNRTITLNGNTYILEDVTLRPKGTADVTFNGRVTDKIAIDGSVSAGGTTLRFIGHKGIIFAGGAELTHLELAESTTEISFASDVTLTGKLTNHGTINQNSGNVQLNGSVLEDGRYNLNAGTLSGVSFAEGSTLVAAEGSKLSGVHFTGGTLDISSLTPGDSAVLTAAGTVSFGSGTQINLVSGLTTGSTYVLFEGADYLEGWTALTSDNFYVISNDYTTGKVSLDVEMTANGFHVVGSNTTYTVGGKSAAFDDAQHVNYTNAWVQLNGGTNGSAASVSSSDKPIVVGGKGGLFLQNWGQGAIVLDNDMYVMDAPIHSNVIHFGNDGSLNETTTLNGNFYVLESIILNSRGSAVIHFNGLLTDKVAIDGTASEGGSTVTFGNENNWRNKGYHIAGGANLTNVVVGVAHAEVSISSDVTLTGTLTNLGTIRQTAGAVQLNHSVLEAGVYKLEGGSLAEVTFGEGSTLVASREGTLADVTIAGGVLDLSASSVVGQPLVQTSGRVSFDATSRVLLNMEGVELNTVYEVFDNAANVTGWDSLTGNNLDFSTAGALKHDASFVLGANSISVSDFGVNYTDMRTSGEGTWDYHSAIWTSAAHSPATPIKFAVGDSAVFSESASLAVRSDGVIAGSVLVNNGATLALSGGCLVAQEGMIIGDGATVTLNTTTNAQGAIQGEVTVQKGGTLQLNSKDVTGYGGGETSLHTLRVEEGGRVVLNFSAGNVNETFAGTLYLDGTVSGTGTWDFYGNACLITGDNKEASISTNVCLRRNDVSLSVGEGSTLTLSGAITEREGNGRMVKSGSGRLDIASAEIASNVKYRVEEGTLEFAGGVGISTVDVTGGALELTNSCSVGTINMVSEASLVTFAGAEGSVYNVNALKSGSFASFARDITVNEGVEVNVTSFENHWGVGTVQVDGVLNVSDTLLLSSGKNTTGNRISGGGVVNVENLVLQNLGSYYFDVATLNIKDATLERMMYVDGGSVNISGSVSSASGRGIDLSGDSELCLKENSSVVLKALSLADSAVISLEKGAVLDLTSMSNYDDGDSARFSKLLNSTAGEGTLKANLAGEFRMAEDTQVNTNVELAGLKVNCYSSNNHSLVITDRGSLSVSGTLTLQSTAAMQIDGGSVQAAAVKLGHSQARNPGHLKLNAGSLVTGEISLTTDNDTGNTFVMTGGVLELTSSVGIAEGVETRITGGVLKAESADWSISDASVGGVTVMGSKTVQLNNATLTSLISNQGNLTLSGTLTVTDLSGFNTDITYTYSDGENGYRTTNGSVRVVDNTGTLNVQNVSLAGELATGSITADGVVTFANHTDNNVYWVNTEADAADVSGVTLAGSGIYRITDVDRITAENAVSMSDDWSGTVLVQNCVANGMNLNNFANETSRLLINGLSGWLRPSDSGAYPSNIDHHLILGENGLTISDSSQRRYCFNGGLSGTGDFIVATASSYVAEFDLRGDLSEWDGAFRVTPHTSSTNTAGINLYVTDGGTVFSGEADCGIFLERKGVLNVFIGNAQADTRIAGDIINAGVSKGESIEYGTLALNLSHNTEIDGTVSVSSVSLSAGANAVFNESLTAGQAVINSGATLSMGKDAALSLENLSGDGLLEMHRLPVQLGITDAWTGTVKLSDASVQGLNLNLLGNAGSVVELSGVSGYMSRADGGTGQTYAANLVLTDSGEAAAYSMTDGYRNDHRIYTGSVSGAGTYERATANCGTQTLVFSGDVSEWTGTLSHKVGKDYGKADLAVTNVTFSGSREIKVNMVTDGYGEFHVSLDDKNLAEGSNTVTLKGDVTADSLTITEGTKAVLESDVNVQKLVVACSAELAEQAAISVDTVTVQAADGEGEKRIALADLSLTGLAGYDREAAVASLISVTAAGDFSFSDISLTGVEFSAENTELSLNNVRLSQDCSFSVGSLGRIQLDSVLLELVLPGLSSSADGILELDCSNLFHCVVNGELDVVLDVDTEELLAAGYRNVTLNLGEDVTYGELTINLDGATYTGNSNGLAQFSLNVPEPGTVTLSLLALASLAARRRRR